MLVTMLWKLKMDNVVVQIFIWGLRFFKKGTHTVKMVGIITTTTTTTTQSVQVTIPSN
jgi:hypothetical protein